jgi:hypothetical protein
MFPADSKDLVLEFLQLLVCIWLDRDCLAQQASRDGKEEAQKTACESRQPDFG